MTESTALFGSDCGDLPFETRQLLCKLLLGPYVEPGSDYWNVLLRDEATVRAFLSNLFLDVVIDRERQVAFVRQADLGQRKEDALVLLRSVPLSFGDSVLLLHLRQLLMEADTRGERAVVDESQLVEHLDIYFAPRGDAINTRKRIEASIQRMKRQSILMAIRNNPQRHEISPALRLLFGADEVEALGALYRNRAAELVDAPEEAHDG